MFIITMAIRLIKKYEKYTLLFVVLILFLLQSANTIASLGQIRLEELDDIRSVFWLQNNLVYNGFYTSLGWYAPLLIVYKIFGFTIHTAKFFKLGLYLVSMLCLAEILKKYLGTNKAIVPLLIIGLSPTLIYFTTSQTPLGIDFLYLPICFYLAISIKFSDKILAFIKQVSFGALSMIAWMSYPTFLFFLPVLFFYYYENLIKQKRKLSLAIRDILITLISFLTPFILLTLSIRNKDVLFNDPNITRGIFRGNGRLNISYDVFSQNIGTLFTDLFIKPVSYYYEAAKVEFSDFYPIIGIITVFLIALYLFYKFAKYRIWIGIITAAIILNILLTSFMTPVNLAGIRRNSVALILFYVLFIFSWWFIFTIKKKYIYLKFALLGSLILLLIHHLLVFPINLENLKNPSKFNDKVWFNIAESAEKSRLQYLETLTENDLILHCEIEGYKKGDCRGYKISLIFGVLAGSCSWNNLSCHNIKIFDPNTDQYIPLTLDYWSERGIIGD